MIVDCQSLCHVRLFVTPWTAARQASLSFTSFWSLLKLMSIELVMAANHLILCYLILFLPRSSQFLTSLKSYLWDFPGSPAVKTWRFHFRGCSFHPWSGIEDPTCHTMRPKLKKKRVVLKKLFLVASSHGATCGRCMFDKVGLMGRLQWLLLFSCSPCRAAHSGCSLTCAWTLCIGKWRLCSLEEWHRRS